MENIQGNIQRFKGNMSANESAVGFHKILLCHMSMHSRATDFYYLESNWQTRVSHQQRLSRVKTTLLLDLYNFLLCPLYTKIGRMKQFIKTLRKINTRSFKYIVETFSKITQTELSYLSLTLN